MDQSTQVFLCNISIQNSRLPINFVRKVKKVYSKFSVYDKKNISKKVLKELFMSIDEIFFKNLFNSYLEAHPPKRHNINFNNYGSILSDVGAFMDTIAYNKNDVEFKRHDFGFNIELDALNSIKSPKIYYSGGYITKSRIIFIIIMLVHESLHIVEYKDTFISRFGDYHTMFFYKYVYLFFGIISHLSDVLDDSDYLVFNTKERIELIESNIETNIKKNGERLLNDHSHYIENDEEKLLGYITHEIFIKNGKLIFIEDVNI